MVKGSVLIVDDESDMRQLISMYLENSGFTSLQASDGHAAFGILKEKNVDLILLDIMMPYEDGFELCARIRKQMDLPIIFLSAKGEEWDKVKALQLGGDDYIVKPFSPGELVARIQAVLRRSRGVLLDEEWVKAGNILIDKRARNVSVNGSVISLTLKEYELLLFFLDHQHFALSREKLLESVWGLDYQGSLRTVDTHVKTLRMKLAPEDYIQTVWGVGYKFEVPAV